MKKIIFSVLLAVSSIAVKCQMTGKIDSLLNKIYTGDKPGASATIVENGKIIFKKSFGIANIKTGEKISSITNFNICSLTKQFTALAILQLAEKHKLALTDKLSHFFPEINKNINPVGRSEYQGVSVNSTLHHNVRPFIDQLMKGDKEQKKYAAKLKLHYLLELTHDGKARPQKEKFLMNFKIWLKGIKPRVAYALFGKLN